MGDRIAEVKDSKKSQRKTTKRPSRSGVLRKAGLWREQGPWHGGSGANGERPVPVQTTCQGGADDLPFFEIRDAVQAKYEMLRMLQKQRQGQDLEDEIVGSCPWRSRPERWTREKIAELFGFRQTAMRDMFRSFEQLGFVALLDGFVWTPKKGKLPDCAAELVKWMRRQDPPVAWKGVCQLLQAVCHVEVNEGALRRMMERRGPRARPPFKRKKLSLGKDPGEGKVKGRASHRKKRSHGSAKASRRAHKPKQ